MSNKRLTIGIVQQRNGSGVEENMERLEEKILGLAREEAQLVVLPELHNSLYFCQTESVD